MDERTQALIDDLQRADDLAGSELNRTARRSAWVAELSPEKLAEFLAAAAELPAPLSPATDRLLASWLLAAVQTRRQTPPASRPADDELVLALNAIESLYAALPASARSRGQLLAWLTSGGSASELELFQRLVLAAPPENDQDVVQMLAPLFQRQRTVAAGLFPSLLGAMGFPALAAPVLDLANFLTRERIVSRHPATDISSELIDLVGELAQMLLLLEEQPDRFGDTPQELSRRVARGVALAVSLADALALIGDKRGVGKLYQALRVGHRRLRTEAAYALVRLGESDAAEELAGLAAEPVARLRVLAYAKELGIEGKIEERYASPESRAEAELCVWLAEPTQYGVPPSACELFDHRRQHWPGYNEPVDCYLFRFQYVVTVEDGERSFSNIGIAGPLVYAFLADMGELPADDIYAAFAGWHAQHEDICEFDVERLSKSERLEVERLKRRLHDEGYTEIDPQRMGYFFGEKALVALVERKGTPGVAVVDFHDTLVFPQRGSRPLGALEAYSIYKGRKLLKAFNR